MSGSLLGFARGAMRSLLALFVVCAVAGCAQTGGGRMAGYNRPTSYDPPGPPSDPWGPYIRDASRRFDVPERWIREVMRQESGGRATATSRVGAQGLMQVMPGTYAELQRRYGFGNDPYHPYDNIMSGAAYIREMYDLYGSPAFLAAYNAGPRRLEDYLWNGGSLPTETRNYVARIGPRIEGASPTRRAPPEVYAAAEIGTFVPAGPRRMDGGTMTALAEQRRARDAAPVQVAAASPTFSAPVRVASASSASAFRPYTGETAMPAPSRGSVPPPDPAFRPFTGETEVSAAPRAPAPPPDPAFRPYSGESEEPIQTASLGGVSTAPLADPAPRGGGRVMSSALAAPSLAAPVRRDARGRPIEVARASPPPPAAGGGGLGLMRSAHAATPPPAPAPASRGQAGGWGVQVGAFASENVARNAAQQARDTVQTLGARTVIQPVQQGGSTLYRARVTGLSRESAEQACNRLRGRGACSIVAPGAT